MAIVAVVVAGCGREPRAEPAGRAAPAAAAVPIEQRVGWLHSTCLAIANAMLAADSPVTIVALGETPAVIDGRIVGMTTSSDKCPALLEDRRATNTANGLSFYDVRLPAGRSIELGIGVAGNPSRVGDGVDLTGDGVAERFTQCATSEGVSFAVTSGAPGQTAALWSAYYYVGYDTEPTCPAK